MVTQDEIKQIVIDVFPESSDKIDVGTNLIDAGILDSMGVLGLVSRLEEKYGITFPDEDITVENFASIDGIAEYMSKIIKS